MSVSGEWSVVSKKDKKRRGTTRGVQTVPARPLSSTSSGAFNRGGVDDEASVFTDADKEHFKKKIQSLVEKTHHTGFYRTLVDELKDDCPIDIVCYGIGNFSTVAASMWQYACILSLQEYVSAENVYFYDPCTTALELELLEDFNVNVIPHNERAFRQVSVRTLFFMPHCPQLLYNNVLVSNWYSLDAIRIFGNSLRAYDLNKIGTGVLHKGIEMLLPYLEETIIECSKQDLQEHYQLEAAFNDCCMIRLQLSSEITLPEGPVVTMGDSLDDVEVV